MDTKNQRGHRSAFNSADSRVRVRKSGKLSPARREYNADRETPAAKEIVDTGLPSARMAWRKDVATCRAACTSTGAPGDSAPPTKVPDVNQLRGGSTRGRPMSPTLPRQSPTGEGATRHEVTESGLVLTNVRTVGHTEIELMFDQGVRS